MKGTTGRSDDRDSPTAVCIPLRAAERRWPVTVLVAGWRLLYSRLAGGYCTRGRLAVTVLVAGYCTRGRLAVTVLAAGWRLLYSWPAGGYCTRGRLLGFDLAAGRRCPASDTHLKQGGVFSSEPALAIVL